MRFLILLCLIILSLTSCSGPGGDFDDSRVPPDQLTAELAARRVLDHGTLEPVLEINQPIEQWQFRRGSTSRTTILGKTTVKIYLYDRSGVEYLVTEATPEAVREKMEGSLYGFATGRVEDVLHEPDPRSVSVTLQLTDWEPRK